MIPPLFASPLPLWAWMSIGTGSGAIVGSWLATAAVRWPEGRATARGRSMCDACGATLRAHELVPLLSWLAQRGRCRRCAARIDPWHVVIEAAAAAIGAVALGISPAMDGAAGAVFGWALLLLAVLDARHLWLPDRVTAPLILAGLAIGVAGAPPPLADRLIGAGAGWASLAGIRALYRVARGREGMGGGDPKLFAAIGAWLGWAGLPFVLLLASAAGLAGAAAAMLAGRRVSGSSEVPLGALLAGGAMLVWAARQVRLLPV